MGHRIDQRADELVLAALHQRRHANREADPQRDPGDRDQGLPPATADMGIGDIHQQVHLTAS
jgi:hypothetical protein